MLTKQAKAPLHPKGSRRTHPEGWFLFGWPLTHLPWSTCRLPADHNSPRLPEQDALSTEVTSPAAWMGPFGFLLQAVTLNLAAGAGRTSSLRTFAEASSPQQSLRAKTPGWAAARAAALPSQPRQAAGTGGTLGQVSPDDAPHPHVPAAGGPASAQGG